MLKDLPPWMAVALSAITLAFGGHFSGKLARRCYLPRISGFVAFGCLARNIGLVTVVSTQPLQGLTRIALGSIAIAAGAELRGDGKATHSFSKTALFSLTLYAVTFVVTFLLMACIDLLDLPPIDGDFKYSERLALALLCSSIATARSPASALAVVAELRASGPFTSRCLQASIMLDALTIFAFPFILCFANMIVSVSSPPSLNYDGNQTLQIVQDRSTTDPFALILPIHHCFSSPALGHLLAVMVARLGQWLLSFKDKTHYYKFFLVVLLPAVTSLVFFAGQSRDGSLALVSWDPMFVCLVLGAGGLSKQAQEVAPLIDTCETMAIYANLCFFVMAGVSLDIERALAAVGPAIFLVLARLSGLRAGTSCGLAAIGERSSPYVHRYWMGFVTQAGISIGLATEVQARFVSGDPKRPLGEMMYTVLLSQITMNQIMGPLLFRYAIVAAGESHAQDIQSQEPYLFGESVTASPVARSITE